MEFGVFNPSTVSIHFFYRLLKVILTISWTKCHCYCGDKVQSCVSVSWLVECLISGGACV